MVTHPLFIILGVLSLACSVVAYNWVFTYRRGRYAQRRNVQVLLTALLVVTGVIGLLYGFGVL